MQWVFHGAFPLGVYLSVGLLVIWETKLQLVDWGAGVGWLGGKFVTWVFLTSSDVDLP